MEDARLMPRITDPEYKAKLQQAGLWKAFYTFRDDLKKKGVRASDAKLAAIAEFNPKLIAMGLIQPGEFEPVAGTGKKTRVKLTKPKEGEVSVPLVFGVSGLREVSPADFPDKVATEAENIRWVARNMAMIPKSITPADCPSPIAWNLLAHCLESPQAKADFWKNTYPKLLPSRSQLEEDKAEKFDGQGQIDVISQIQNIVDKVNEGGDE